jgi:hypothetical protein
MHYKGFNIEIVNGHLNTWHYKIFMGKKPFSRMCLISIKAGVTVIDTYLKSLENDRV